MKRRFFLPFLLPRVFRPTVLEVFQITNLELGTAFGVYGAVAMLAYISGGPLADRFGARNMLAAALLTTAAGGMVLMTVPGMSTLIALYAYWGITTIALFWAPLIKATRDWGGAGEQGVAFGLLDGGRGLLAALTASLMVYVIAALLPTDPATATLAERSAALSQVIVLLLSLTAGMAAVLWLLLPAGSSASSAQPEKLNLHGLAHVARMPTVWLQALIILCAYVGFKSVDDFSLYANEVLGVNQVEAAGLGTVSLWVRPVAAVAGRFCGGPLWRGPHDGAQFCAHGTRRCGAGLRCYHRGRLRAVPDDGRRHQPGHLCTARFVFRHHARRARAARLHRQRGGPGIADRLHAGCVHGPIDGLVAGPLTRCRRASACVYAHVRCGAGRACHQPGVSAHHAHCIRCC